jgi:heptosyltransferase II
MDMQQKNILIRLPNWLGDMVMATAFVQAVAQQYPAAVIDVIAKKGLDFLLDYFPSLGERYVFSKADYKGIRGAWRFGKQIGKSKPYDIVFCLPNSFSSAVMAKAIRAKQVVGYRKELRSLLLTHHYAIPQVLHRVDEYVQLLRLFAGYDKHTPPVQLQLPTVQKQQRLVININSEAASRRLPVAKAVSIINAVRVQTDCTIVLIGSPTEAAFVQEVYQQLDTVEGIENRAGQTNLPQLLQLLAASTVMLSTDSGPAHVANALGVHTVVLFGAGNEKSTAPFNDNKTIIRLGQLPCEPCVSNTCKLYGTPRCLTLLSEALVTQAVINALQKKDREKQAP